MSKRRCKLRIWRNMSYQEIFMQRAVELAKECATFDEVPVGAVVVKNGRIVAESGNRKERENNAVCHAEIVAISEATKAQNNWWLEDCDIYVTLEPCAMCAGAMINSRIRALYFGAYDEKTGACGSKINLFEQGLFNHDVEVSGGHLQDECAKLLSDFFRKKRKAKTEDKIAAE